MLSLEYLNKLYATYQDVATIQVEEFSIRNRAFLFNTQPAIMGVVNFSSESWYRESVCLSLGMATQRSHILAAQGADIIDVGTESTLGYTEKIGEEHQINQLLPLLGALKQTDIITSIETYYTGVAYESLKAGADIINYTGRSDSTIMYEIVADFDAAIILCYLQGQHVRDVQDLIFENDPISTMYNYFSKALEAATKAGVKKIFIDPGLGFYYKNLKDSASRINFQMQIFLNSFRLRKLGFPICNALPHAFECFGEEVRTAEGFFAVLAALGKTNLFRTHEVSRVKAILDTMALFTLDSTVASSQRIDS